MEQLVSTNITSSTIGTARTVGIFMEHIEQYFKLLNSENSWKPPRTVGTVGTFCIVNTVG